MKKMKYFNSLFIIAILCFGKNLSAGEFSVNEKKEIILNDFATKLDEPEFNLSPVSKKAFDVMKRITVFPEDVNVEEVILNHSDDVVFLTSPPHFIHKHILVCTNLHDNDIRLSYDVDTDDFIFHSNDSVLEKRLLSENDPLVIYELDYYGLHHKKRDTKAAQDYPSFIMIEQETTLSPSFKRQGDGKYYVEIASGSRDGKVTATGNHNWLRLIDGDGNVISVGFHPKITMTSMNAYAQLPIRFFNSDIYEWVDNRIYYAHTFPLHESEYDALKEDIINDMIAITQPENSFDYSILEYNCVHWIIEKLSNIFTFNEEEIKIHLYASNFPDWLEYYRKEASDEFKMIVDPLLYLAHYGTHIPLCIAAYFCGGWILNDENDNSSAFLGDSYRLTDFDMHVSYHPFLLEEYFQNHERELYEERVKTISEIENYRLK